MEKTGNDLDMALVLRSQNGDREAFEKLVLKYQDRIFNMILRMTGDYEVSLDLTQETFLRAYQSLKGFQGKCAFFTWLFRIAFNIMASRRRAFIRKPRNFSISQYKNKEEKQNSEFPEPESSEPPPYSYIIQEEMKSIVQNAIFSLPEEFRQALILRDIEGMSYEEIQEVMQCSLGTVRSRIHRARNLLREKLKDCEEIKGKGA